jgi:nucleoside-diphosphate-sugar epimerase
MGSGSSLPLAIFSFLFIILIQFVFLGRLLNMLHYEDAASAVICAILAGKGEITYLVSDDEPVTREDICKAALESGLFPGAKMPTFKAETGPRGKTCDCSKTKNAIGWEPKYPSFQEYMYGIGGKSFKRPKTLKEKMNTLWIPGSDDSDDLLSL